MAKKKKELTPKESVIKHTEDSFDVFVVAGYRTDNGTVDVISTAGSYADIQYLLSKGSFEMHLHQKAKELNDKEITE